MEKLPSCQVAKARRLLLYGRCVCEVVGSYSLRHVKPLLLSMGIEVAFLLWGWGRGPYLLDMRSL